MGGNSINDGRTLLADRLVDFAGMVRPVNDTSAALAEAPTPADAILANGTTAADKDKIAEFFKVDTEVDEDTFVQKCMGKDHLWGSKFDRTKELKNNNRKDCKAQFKRQSYNSTGRKK